MKASTMVNLVAKRPKVFEQPEFTKSLVTLYSDFFSCKPYDF